MDNLQNGITAFKNGKREDARKYLIAAVKENPKDENAWGWLYQVANNDNERIECLKKVIEINPNNEKAKQLLNQLLTPPLTPTPAMTNSPQQKRINLLPSSSKQVNSPSIAARKSNRKILTYSIVIIFSLCLVCLVAVLSTNTAVPSQNSEQVTKKQLIVPVGKLAQYENTYSDYDEVFVTKKDGSLDERPNDLEELCLDYLFYRNKILEYTQAGQTEKATEARTAWNEINVWLSTYNEDDIGTMWTIIEKRNK